MARISTFILRRGSEARKMFREEGWNAVPGFIERHEQLKKDHLHKAQNMELEEFQFLFTAFMTVALGTIELRALHRMATWIRNVHKELPQHRQDDKLEQKLQCRLKRHVLKQAKSLWAKTKENAPTSSRDAWNELVKKFRLFLSVHDLTLESVGSSQALITELRRLNRRSSAQRGEAPMKRPGPVPKG